MISRDNCNCLRSIFSFTVFLFAELCSTLACVKIAAASHCKHGEMTSNIKEDSISHSGFKTKAKDIEATSKSTVDRAVKGMWLSHVAESGRVKFRG